MAEIEYTRLHITPFSSALLNTILPASVLPNARNISYHEIQTFPEKSYGYVELPTMDAEKVKKRLNGSILKGTKVRIEKARPQKEVLLEEEEPQKHKKEKKKRKRDELPGVDIGERHVKRGWTTPGKDVVKTKDKKDKMVIKSKYTTGPECLFKTVLPPNVASNSKDTKLKPDRDKRGKAGKEAVVHEFAKTTKYATFLKGSSGSKKSKSAVEFVEGKGWIDEEGNVVEEFKKSKKHKHWEPETVLVPLPAESDRSSAPEEDSADEAEAQPERIEVDAEVIPVVVEEARSSSSDDSRPSDESDTNELEGKKAVVQEASALSSDSEVEELKVKRAAGEDEVDTSSSESDSDSFSSEEESEPAEPQSTSTSRPQSSAGPALSLKIPESASTPVVHPLEALYKKPEFNISKPAPEPSSFSFFGADGEEDDVEVSSQLQVPLTPFTQRDFEWRGIRSAAPTPDTAHANKKFIWPVENDIEVEDDDEAPASSPIRKKENAAGKKSEEEDSGEAETEFQKWFWENRGNVNRAWKKRRKVVGKEKRQRENRKRSDRAV